MPIISIFTKCPVPACLVSLLAAWAAVLQPHISILFLIMVLITIDVITGVINACRTKCLRSSILQAGILKKFTFFAIVVLIEILFSTPPITIGASFLLWLFAGSETLSILENLAKMYPNDRIISFIKRFCEKTIKKAEDNFLETISETKEETKVEAKNDKKIS